MSSIRKVRVFINPRSGLGRSFAQAQEVLQKHWDVEGIDLTYQFSRSAEDGVTKVHRAVAEGVDTILAVGGDGMVNSIGGALVGSDVAFGVLPTGSGNGFARHFGIPLAVDRAARELARSERRTIDVATANGRPFLITCSMAWDAAIVRSFEKSPVRGILPYVFAGAYELMGYVPQPFEVTVDDEAPVRWKDPLVFTVANLTQFGGGAIVAKDACPDDGLLELVVLTQRDAPRLLGDLPLLLSGSPNEISYVTTRKFSRLHVHREQPAPIQVDGELVEGWADVTVEVLPKALTVLIPPDSGG